MIDQLLVFGYLILVLSIALANRSKIATFKNFTTIGSNLKSSKLLLTATIFTSSVGGATCFGIASKVYAGQMSYAYGLIISIIVDLLIAYFLVPKISKHYGAETVGDIVYKFYGNEGRIISGVAAVMVSIGFVAAQINICGLLFSYLFNLSYTYGVILSYGIIIIYTTIGGLKSIIWTNLLQFFSIILSVPLLTIVGFKKIELAKIIATSKILLERQDNLTYAIIAAILSYSVMNLYPTLIQRILLNPTPQITSRAIYTKSIIYGLFIIIIILNGVLSFSFNPDIPPSNALLHLMQEILPTGLQGLVIIGFLAAVMSTADADLNIATVSLIKDLLNPVLKIHNPKHLLLLARIMNIICGVITIFIALSFSNVIDLVIFTTGFWGPLILVPLVFLLYDITISPKQMIMTGLAGGTSFLIWEYYFGYLLLKGVFIGTFTSLIVFLIYLLLNKQDYKLLTGFTKKL